MEVEKFNYHFNNLNDNHPKGDNVEGLNVDFRNNQKTAFYHCKVLERNEGFIVNNTSSYENYEVQVFCNRAIISCKVGSGKSFVVLGLILSQPKLYFNRTVPDNNGNCAFSLKKVNNENKTLSSNIILVPHKLFTQWKKYIEEKTDIDNLVSFSTPKELANNFGSYVTKYSDGEMTKEEFIENHLENKVFLIPSTRWNAFVNLFDEVKCNKKFSRIFIDEVHDINIPGCQSIPVNFIWFISSSLHDSRYIKNNGFIRDSIYSLFWNEFTNYLTIKTEDAYVDASQNLIKPNISIIKCRSHMLMNILDGVITSEIRDMLAAEDINGVVQALGIEQATESNIIGKICSDLEKELENAKLDLEYKAKKHYASKNAKEDALKNAQHKIDSIQDKIDNVMKRINECELDPIMQCEIEKPVITPCCKNKFDLESLTSYFEYEQQKYIHRVPCPLCRKPLMMNKLIYLGEIEEKTQEEEVGFNTEKHDKIDNLKHLLEEIDIDKRILIFSSHEGNLSDMQKVFNEVGRENLRALKGSRATIDSILNKYKSGEIKNIFLNAQHSASGLNLEMTDIIIIMHKMSPDTLKQIVGRAQRLGRTSVLNVYQLVGVNE